MSINVKKNSFYLSITMILLLSLITSILYVVGFNFYYAYIGTFDIPYELFNFDFHQILYFGSAALIVVFLKKLLILVFLLALLHFIYLIAFNLLTRFKQTKAFLNRVSNVKKFSCETPAGADSFARQCASFLMIISIILIIGVVFLFARAIGEKTGEQEGLKRKNEYTIVFDKLKNKKDISHEGLLFFTLPHQTTKKAGFILASNEIFTALYTNTDGLEILKTSDINKMVLHFPRTEYPK